MYFERKKFYVGLETTISAFDREEAKKKVTKILDILKDYGIDAYCTCLD